MKNKDLTKNRENSLANLRPSRPGMTNNPNGRPVGSKNVSTILKERLQEMAPDTTVSNEFVRKFARGKKVITNADAIALRLLDQAINKGELPAIKEVLDRSEGKPQQSVAVTTDNSSLAIANELASILVTKYGMKPETVIEAVAEKCQLPPDQIVIEAVQ